ncbi:MAG TPA: dockerin type I domain-containing protein [Candidatus Saccharimonadales bacterium]|nr:dockerin type I domain-containing protein [Candidatus Saccharimonadales bacterium]
MREHHGNYHLGAGFTLAIIGCLLVVLMIAGVSGPSSSPGTAGAVLGATIQINHSKKLRPINIHGRKRVCSLPRKGSVACQAEIALNSSGQPLIASPASSGALGPQQFHVGYQLPCTPGGAVESACPSPSTYGPETIAIVDAGNFSSGVSGLESSLSGYDQYYGLPACSTSNGCLSVVNQSGSASSLPADAGWSDEIALDVETAHMVCQSCRVVLVEANDAYTSDLAAAEATAASFNPDAISNSWGDTTDDYSYDSNFEKPGIAIVASAGDSGSVGNGASWPADIPDVVGVAGTTLQLNTDNTWAGESLWSGSGGGCSTYYSAPSWQTGLTDWTNNGCGSYRSFADVSADADPNTGAAVYLNGSWYEIGGTSLSAPLVASIYALDGGLPSTAIGSSVPYADASTANFHDISSGSDCVSGVTVHCTATNGFDTPTGLGSPNGTAGLAALPTPPDLSADIVNQNEIMLKWTPSSSTSAISGYHVYRNGVLAATVTTTSYDDTGLTPNTTYSYYVTGYDSSGAVSSQSSTVSALSAYPADINADGHINVLDLSLLASKYGQCSSTVGRADINGDGCVNLLDLSILANKYGSE